MNKKTSFLYLALEAIGKLDNLREDKDIYITGKKLIRTSKNFPSSIVIDYISRHYEYIRDYEKTKTFLEKHERVFCYTNVQIFYYLYLGYSLKKSGYMIYAMKRISTSKHIEKLNYIGYKDWFDFYLNLAKGFKMGEWKIPYNSLSKILNAELEIRKVLLEEIDDTGLIFGRGKKYAWNNCKLAFFLDQQQEVIKAYREGIFFLLYNKYKKYRLDNVYTQQSLNGKLKNRY